MSYSVTLYDMMVSVTTTCINQNSRAKCTLSAGIVW